MLKRFFQFMLGINGASIIRGLRLGFKEFINGSLEAFGASHPLESRTNNETKRELEKIPKIMVDELLGAAKTSIKINAQKYEGGMLPLNDVVALLSILTTEKPVEVLEIGTFMGHTTKAMAENLSDSLIHTVDLPPDYKIEPDQNSKVPKDDFHLIQARTIGREFKNSSLKTKIKQHFGDTATIDFREFGQPMFFFIDGSHTYEYCKQDTEKCFELCRGVGIFLWHDCDLFHPGVVKFISEWKAAGRNVYLIEGTSLAYWNGNQSNFTVMTE